MPNFESEGEGGDLTYLLVQVLDRVSRSKSSQSHERKIPLVGGTPLFIVQSESALVDQEAKNKMLHNIKEVYWVRRI